MLTSVKGNLTRIKKGTQKLSQREEKEIDCKMEAPKNFASQRGINHFILCARQRTLPASQALWGP